MDLFSLPVILGIIALGISCLGLGYSLGKQKSLDDIQVQVDSYLLSQYILATKDGNNKNQNERR